jgi:phage gpG-like protein
LLRIFGNLMVRSVQQTFREEGSPAGSWRRVFAGSRFARYERPGRTGKSRKTLKQSGEMTAGFARWNATEKILGGASGRLARSVTFAVEPNLVRIGSNVIYARIHQLGGAIVPKNKKFLRFPIGGGQFVFTKKVTMPARPYLVLRPEDPGRLSEAGRDWLMAQFKIGGGPAPVGEW